MMPDDWQEMRQRHREYVKRLSDMLERVAPRECISDNEYYDACVWCCKLPNLKNRNLRLKQSHLDDCPWVEARRLLGDNLED